MNTVQLIYQAVTTTTEELPQKTMGGAETDAKGELVLPINRVQRKYFKRLGKQKTRVLEEVTMYAAKCPSFPAGTSEAACFLLNKQRSPISFSNQGTPDIFVAS